MGAPAPTGDAKLGHYVPQDFPAPVRAIAAVSRLFALLEGIGIGICLVSLVALAVFQFVARNLRMHGQLWFPAAPDWIDGVIRHSVFLLGFLGAAYATFTGRHIRIDAVTRMTKPRARMALRIVTTIAAVTILAVLIRAGLEFLKVATEESGEASSEGQIFTSARGAMIIIGGLALIAFHFVVQVIIDLVWVVSGKTPPASWIAEASHGEAPPTTGQEGMMPPPEMVLERGDDKLGAALTAAAHEKGGAATDGIAAKSAAPTGSDAAKKDDAPGGGDK